MSAQKAAQKGQGPDRPTQANRSPNETPRDTRRITQDRSDFDSASLLEIVNAPEDGVQRITVTQAEIALVIAHIAHRYELTPKELALYLYECRRKAVHPLSNLIVPRVNWVTKRRPTGDVKERALTFITSVDYMRSRAHATGVCMGITDPAYDEDGEYPYTATVTVYRFVQGHICPFTATAYWDEYYPGDGAAGFMWREMPHVMLGKTAEALALRKGFPEQLQGLYAFEEMHQADREDPRVPRQRRSADIIHHPTAPQPVPALPPAQPAERLEIPARDVVPVARDPRDSAGRRLQQDESRPATGRPAINQASTSRRAAHTSGQATETRTNSTAIPEGAYRITRIDQRERQGKSGGKEPFWKLTIVNHRGVQETAYAWSRLMGETAQRLHRQNQLVALQLKRRDGTDGQTYLDVDEVSAFGAILDIDRTREDDDAPDAHLFPETAQEGGDHAAL